jgi:hypothetical protein
MATPAHTTTASFTTSANTPSETNSIVNVVPVATNINDDGNVNRESTYTTLEEAIIQYNSNYSRRYILITKKRRYK